MSQSQPLSILVLNVKSTLLECIFMLYVNHHSTAQLLRNLNLCSLISEHVDYVVDEISRGNAFFDEPSIINLLEGFDFQLKENLEKDLNIGETQRILNPMVDILLELPYQNH